MNKGDYRYNYRESARGKKKPDDEVVYIPAVFPPLVDPELWERVNAIIKDNGAKAKTSLNPHKKKHTHVFAGVLRCAECGAGFQVSRLDKPRLNGFRPSLYICTSRRTYRACEALGASDVVIGSFVFNFVANLVAVSAARRGLMKPKSGFCKATRFLACFGLTRYRFAKFSTLCAACPVAVLPLSPRRLKRKKTIKPPRSRRSETKPQRSGGRWNVSKRRIYSTTML